MKERRKESPEIYSGTAVICSATFVSFCNFVSTIPSFLILLFLFLCGVYSVLLVSVVSASYSIVRYTAQC